MEKVLWIAGHKGLGVERVVRMADVDLSILYQEVRVNKIPKALTAERRSVWVCGILKAMERAVSPTFF